MSARQKGQTLEALKAKAQKDIGTTKRALDKLKIIAPERSHLRKMAEDCLSMAKAYYNDAVHFFEKGDYINAFACVNYAHGWLDAGVRAGLFRVLSSRDLFTVGPL